MGAYSNYYFMGCSKCKIKENMFTDYEHFKIGYSVYVFICPHVYPQKQEFTPKWKKVDLT